MGKSYADDLRVVVIWLIRDGHTRAEVAELCAIRLSSVGRYLKRHRETGSVSLGEFGGHTGHALERHTDRLRRWISLQPDLTLAEIRARLAGMRVNVAISSIWRFLNHIGLTEDWAGEFV
jgi:transposase